MRFLRTATLLGLIALIAGAAEPIPPKVDRVLPLAEDPLADAPGVFFHEDFDTIAKLGERFQDQNSSKGRFLPSDTAAFSGRRGLEQIYLPKEEMEGDPGEAGWAWRMFGDNPYPADTKGGQPVRTVVARWYHKFPQDFQPRVDDKGKRHWVPKFARMKCMDGKEWKGIWGLYVWIAGDDGHISVERHTYAPDAHREWLPNHHARFAFSEPHNLGRWIHFELRLAVGDAPRSDRIQLWADGLLVCDIRNDDLNAGYMAFGPNAMALDCYWNKGSPVRQSRFYDDFMLGSQPIGPARTPLNPVLELGVDPSAEAVEVELAAASQRPLVDAKTIDGVVVRHEELGYDLDPVWTGGGEDLASITVDTEHGSFAAAGAQALRPNTLHLLRVRQRIDGEWSAWSGWHGGFATVWADDDQERRPPEGYLIPE